MNLNDVHRGIRKRKKRRRVGRGPGSGSGKTCGRGHKGQASRAGWSKHPTFQGGTMALVRRIPKRGFHNKCGKLVAVVNASDLQDCFDSGQAVTPETLRQKHLCKGRYDELKILGNGELSKKLNVSAHRFSKTALKKIEGAGGTAIVLSSELLKASASPIAKDE